MTRREHRNPTSRSRGRRPGALPLLALLLAGTLLVGACGDSPAGLHELSPEGTVEIRASVRSPTVSTLVVEVTAPDLPEALVFNLELVGSDTDGDGEDDEFTASSTLTVPAGADRLFAVRAFDTGGIQSHEGAATMDVTPGANATAVVVTLHPLTGDQPIDIVLGSFEVAVTPESATIDVGATQQFTAEITDDNGPVDGAVADWATTNPGVATVDASGLATGLDVGTASIVATYGGVAGTAALTVGEPTGPVTEEEVCDGVDNDGDGQIDEGFAYCIDGAPAPNTDGATCDDGFVDANGDPADGCEATAETEVCDGIDNDLDGVIDEGFPYCVNGQPAPNTDGATCDDGFFDVNGDPADGCEVQAPQSGDLVINEIMIDPAGIPDADGEWFEVFNVSSRDLDLHGTSVQVGTSTFVIDRSLLVPAGGFVVFTRNGAPSLNGGVTSDFDYDDGIALSNTESVDMTLTNPGGSTVDVAPTLPTQISEGSSQSLDPAFATAPGNDASGSWCEGTSVYDTTNGNLGTPGAANTSC